MIVGDASRVFDHVRHGMEMTIVCARFPNKFLQYVFHRGSYKSACWGVCVVFVHRQREGEASGLLDNRVAWVFS